MKKKLICILLTVFMVAALVPISALAEEPQVVNSWEELKSAVNSDGEIKLGKDILSKGILDIKKNIILDLNGYALVGDYSNRIITVEENGVFILNDSSAEKKGKIIRGRMRYYQDGGGVYVNGGNFTMNGGTINDNTAEGFGGGVYVKSGSFIMNGGTISGNTSGAGGGGVYVWRGSFTMTGGEISGNRAKEGGGAYVYEGSFTMIGGNITGNTADFGSGVCFSQSDVILGGTAKIKDNMMRNYEKMPQNLYVRHNQKITIGTDEAAPQEGMDIGVTMHFRTGVFTTNGTADDVQYFNSDNTNDAVKYNEGGYLEVVEKGQEEPVEPTKDDPAQDNPAQSEETNKSPATGITKNNTTTLIMIGVIVLAAVGLGVVLVVRRKKH